MLDSEMMWDHAGLPSRDLGGPSEQGPTAETAPSVEHPSVPPRNGALSRIVALAARSPAGASDGGRAASATPRVLQQEDAPKLPAETVSSGAASVELGIVPEELVTLSRSLWSTNVVRQAARRYLARLVDVGEPRATTAEIARYLRMSAELKRVQQAKFPIAVVCIREEFEDWLRRVRMERSQGESFPSAGQTSTRNAIGSIPSDVLHPKELEERAMLFSRQLGRDAHTPTVRNAQIDVPKEA